jgi:hypothetical protein
MYIVFLIKVIKKSHMLSVVSNFNYLHPVATLKKEITSYFEF